MGRPHRRTSTDASRLALFREAAAIVDAELAEPITLVEVAGRLGASPRQLRRSFAEAGGTTFGTYVREARMARARELLLGTDLTVREVARAVGYAEPAQFAKAFKRSHGATPARLRASGAA